MDNDTQMAAEQHRDILLRQHELLEHLEYLYVVSAEHFGAKESCEELAAELGLSKEFKQIIEDE